MSREQAVPGIQHGCFADFTCKRSIGVSYCAWSNHYMALLVAQDYVQNEPFVPQIVQAASDISKAVEASR